MAILRGTSGDDRLAGGAGADILDGGAGNDTLSGGPGNDVYRIGAGHDVIIDTSGSDALRVAGVASLYFQRSGNDLVVLMPGTGRSPQTATVQGHYSGRRVERFVFALPSGTTREWIIQPGLTGGGRSDILVGTDRGDALSGLGDGDNLCAGDGDDTLSGGAASDFLSGGPGDDQIDGGDGGSDYAAYWDSPDAVTVNLTEGFAEDGWGSTDILIGVEQAGGSPFNDILIGNAHANRFFGYRGSNTIVGGAGIDQVSYFIGPGGIAADLATGTVRNGWGGVDRVSGIEDVEGSSFADRIHGSAVENWISPHGGNDLVDGREDYDTVLYGSSPGGVVVDLAGGRAADGWGGTDTLIGIESVFASLHADRLTGNAASNQFRGMAGADTIDGGDGVDIVSYLDDPAGVRVTLATRRAKDGWGDTDVLAGIEEVHGSRQADTLIGDDGANWLRGYDGNDILNGGDGFDFASYADDLAGVTVDLAGGTAVDGQGGRDTLRRIEGVYGTAHSDTLRGNASANFFRGYGGDDVIDGRGGIDTVRFDGARATYRVTGLGGGRYRLAGPEGTNTLRDIEYVLFGSGSSIPIGSLVAGAPRADAPPPEPVAWLARLLDRYAEPAPALAPGEGGRPGDRFGPDRAILALHTLGPTLY